MRAVRFFADEAGAPGDGENLLEMQRLALVDELKKLSGGGSPLAGVTFASPVSSLQVAGELGHEEGGCSGFRREHACGNGGDSGRRRERARGP